ncbi:hypothetical protein [Teredinibacter sp. KSP-S5-2]|uniref:hypothetical protein n=1 Tax=Teredinibacter sp. KSP-S5-2 TaxID=3034506 RepID=UPI0029343F98|nr:hypothetical protein [Teredinibacter sp. KSP-S5-2]WNO09150.1 hypothetical protein P5V12_19600 [Teredinibacter sp. KSP-S5-2]
MFGIFKKKEVGWPFDQPKNCAVFTIRQIIEDKAPIQIVYHDLEDGSWQFLSNIEYTIADVKLVGLEEIAKIDLTVFEVAKIDPGYHAWRNNIGDKWTIAKTPADTEE